MQISTGNIRKAVIPCAGKGTRLYPLTYGIPKVLIPLGAKPVLQHVIDLAIECGIDMFSLVISPDQESIVHYCKKQMPDVNIQFEIQEIQNGLADAVRLSRDFVEKDPFILLLPDTMLYSDNTPNPVARVINTFTNENPGAVILVEWCEDSVLHKFGIVKPCSPIGEYFKVDALVEKPAQGTAPSNYAIGGTYALSPEIFDCIDRTPPGASGELQITDSISILLENGRSVFCVPTKQGERRIDIGSFESYFEAFEIEIAYWRKQQKQD